MAIVTVNSDAWSIDKSFRIQGSFLYKWGSLRFKAKPSQIVLLGVPKFVVVLNTRPDGYVYLNPDRLVIIHPDKEWPVWEQ